MNDFGEQSKHAEPEQRPLSEILYSELLALPEDQRYTMLKHDIANTISISLGVTQLLDDTQSSEAIKNAYNNIFPPGDTSSDAGHPTPNITPALLEQLNNAIQNINTDTLMNGLGENDPIRPLVEQVKCLQHIFPSLLLSLRYLNGDRTVERDLFSQTTVTLGQLALFFGATLDQSSKVHAHTVLTHVDVLMLFNLLHNAKKFTPNPQNPNITLIYNPVNSQGSVANPADIKPPDTLFSPGVAGEGGNTGYGLSIARLYASLLDKNLSCKSRANSEPNNEPPFIVTFEITDQPQRNEHS